MSRRESRKQYYAEKEKEYIRDYNKYSELWSKRRESEVWVELDKPVPNGYLRYFVLRDDVSRSKKAKDMQFLLDNFLQNQWWSRTKKFKKKQKFIKRTGSGFSEWVHKKIEQKLECVEEKDWKKVPEHLQRYFKRIELEKRPWDNVSIFAYKFRFSWMFVFKIEHDYLTHQRLPQGEIDSEINRLHSKLWHQGRGARLVDRFNYTDPYKEIQKQYEKAADKRKIKQEIDEGLFFNENPIERKYN